VSLRIRTLEAELGSPLFIRAGRGVVPTPAGVRLASRVRLAMDGISEAINEFNATSPPLRVTVPPTFAGRWLAPRLPAFSTIGSAAIELDISSDLREPDDFDVAIRTGRGGWEGLEEYALMPVDVTPMVSPILLGRKTLTSPADLVNFELLPHPAWSRWFARAETEMPAGLRFAAVDYSIFELIANAAMAGAGVALLSPTLFRPLLESGQLVAPLQTVLKGPDWYFALVKDSDRRTAPREFCDWLRRQCTGDEAVPEVQAERKRNG